MEKGNTMKKRVLPLSQSNNSKPAQSIYGILTQSIIGKAASAPTWMIRAGITAVLLSGLSLPLAIARRKIAALTIELHLKEEAERKAETQKKLDEEQRARDLLDKEIAESKIRAMKSITAIATLEKDLGDTIAAIAKAVTWEEIQIK
jgi:hypothetical protein